MTLKNLVKKYAKLKTHADELREKSGIVELERDLDETLNQIKNTAREASDDMVAGARALGYRLMVSKPFRSYYDMKAIQKHASKSELKIVEDEALKVEVDRAKFDKLVEAGMVSRELRQKAFREEAQTPRVSVVPEKE